MSFVNCNHQPRLGVRTTDCQSHHRGLEPSQPSDRWYFARPVPHHPPFAPCPREAGRLWTQPVVGEGRSCYCFRMSPLACTAGPHSLCGHWKEMSRLVCSVCVCRVDYCALLGWSLSGDDKLPVALPENNFSAHKLGEQLGPVLAVPTTSASTTSGSGGARMPAAPKPRCVRPERWAGLRPTHNQSPSQLKPDTRLLPCSPLAVAGSTQLCPRGQCQEELGSASSKLLPSDISPKEPSQVKCTVSPAHNLSGGQGSQ